MELTTERKFVKAYVVPLPSDLCTAVIDGVRQRYSRVESCEGGVVPLGYVAHVNCRYHVSGEVKHCTVRDVQRIRDCT